MVVVTPTFVMGKFLTNFDFKLRKSPQVSCGIAANNFNTGVWLIIWENCFFSSFFQQSISHSNESPDTLNCILFLCLMITISCYIKVSPVSPLLRCKLSPVLISWTFLQSGKRPCWPEYLNWVDHHKWSRSVIIISS